MFLQRLLVNKITGNRVSIQYLLWLFQLVCWIRDAEMCTTLLTCPLLLLAMDEDVQEEMNSATILK